MAEKQECQTNAKSAHWDLEDHIRGVLYGNCIGDAIGLLTEFLSKAEAQQIYGKNADKLEYDQKVDDFHRSRWVIGDWTDDSDQMILIMQSILDNKGKIEDVDFGKRLKNWARKGFPELGDLGGCGIGSTTYHVLKHAKYETAPAEAAKEIWELTGRFVAPNGAVMRTSVLGVHQFWDLQKVVENTCKMSRVTHADPRCTASCIAVTCAIAYMLQRNAPHIKPDGTYNIPQIIQDSYKEAVKCFPEGNEENKKEMHYHMVECEDLAGLKLDEDKKIGYTYKCLGAGFWALRQDDFRTALQQIVMEAGDADTNGAVAGALLGCKVGYRNLPETWKTRLAKQQQEWFGKIVEKFLRLLYQELPPQYEQQDESVSEMDIGQTDNQTAEKDNLERNDDSKSAKGENPNIENKTEVTSDDTKKTEDPEDPEKTDDESKKNAPVTTPVKETKL